MSRVCIDCRWFNFNSHLLCTSRKDTRLRCDKKHWDAQNYIYTDDFGSVVLVLEEFRQAIVQAPYCTDYRRNG
ncbi:MAG: hypothetical protein ACXABY_37330 [Candidatus Thorarchaeota archaeon]|jgi:hypothetical protein